MVVKVLVVDDSGFFRRRVSEILSADTSIQVVGTATNGKEAIDQALALKPDVITMDYEMPMMDGITAVRHIMQRCPTPVLMFSSLTHEGARVTLDALDAGAVDFLPKNFEDISRNPDKVRQLLCEKVHSISAATAASVPTAHRRLRRLLRPRQRRHLLRRTTSTRHRFAVLRHLHLRARRQPARRRQRPSARPTNWSLSARLPVVRWHCNGS